MKREIGLVSNVGGTANKYLVVAFDVDSIL